MTNSILLNTIRALDQEEIRALRKWLNSPYHNQREDVIQLFEYLCRFHSDKYLRREVIFKSLFPSKVYAIQLLRYTMSFLLKNIENFLVYRKLKAQKVSYKIHLASILKQKGVDKHFEKEVNTAYLQLKEQSLRNEDYYHYQYQLGLQQYEHNARHQRIDATSFLNFSNQFDIYLIIQKLKHACTAASIGNLTSAQDKDLLVDYLLQYVKENNYLDYAAVAIYYYGYLMLTSLESSSHYQALKSILQNQHDLFPNPELSNIYILAINYCTKKYNQGGTSFLEEVFDLYQEGITRKIFIQNDTLSRFVYKNVVMIGVKLQKLDWVYAFIHDYKEKLESEHRESTFHYNLGIYYYKKLDYKKAMLLLQQVEFDDFLYNLNARSMLLKIYYNLDEIDVLYSFLDSFRLFLYRHQSKIGYHKRHYLNLIKFTKLLLRLDFHNKKSKAALYKKIEETSSVADKEWLLEQLK